MPDDQVEALMKEIYITFYIVKGGVQLRNPENPTADPLLFKNELVEQMYLPTVKQNKETFYFIDFNHVETNDERINFLGEPATYSYLTYT